MSRDDERISEDLPEKRRRRPDPDDRDDNRISKDPLEKRRRRPEPEPDDRDDDFEDRPRRRRRHDEESFTNPQDLRKIAIFQKGVLFCILGYFVLVPLQFAIPQEIRWVMALPALGVVLTATAFVFLLAVELHGTAPGILFGFLTLIPCIGLVTLLVINSKATTALQRAGFRVGFMGARLSDFDREDD